MIKNFLNTRALSINDRVIFYDKCASMLEEGISLFLAIEQMKNISTKLNQDRKAKMYSDWIQRLKKGQRLEEVFLGYIPKNELIVLSISEKTGEMVSGFRSLIETVNLQRKIKNELLSAIIKPFGSIIVAIGVVIFFSIKVYPVFENAIPYEKWPAVSMFMYGIGKFFLSYKSIFLFVIIVCVIVLLRMYCIHSKSEIRNRLDIIPPFSIYKRILATNILQSLSVLLKSNISLSESIDLLKKNNEGWAKNKMDLMSVNLKKGLSPEKLVDVGLFDINTMSDMAIFLERDNIALNIYKISKRLESRLDNFFVKLSTTINSIMLFLLASLTGAIYYSIFLLTQLIGS